MKEFGSNFHRCEHNFLGKNNLLSFLGSNNLYVSGRNCIDVIIELERAKRIWMPAYFCYDVIEHIEKYGVEVLLYDDNPLSNEDDFVVRSLPYKRGDVLFRTDYFGLRKKRNNKGLCVPVVEDHTHGLLTSWARLSDADWCIASLRKSLPIIAGGVLWSPKGKNLPKGIEPSMDCIHMAQIGYSAMNMKSIYLMQQNLELDKDIEIKHLFYQKYLEVETMIEKMHISGVDPETVMITDTFDIEKWFNRKISNWQLARTVLDKRFNIIEPELNNYCQPFSLILLLESLKQRDKLSNYLISNKIYPSILWKMPENSPFEKALDFSKRMLSIHCDGRYNAEDILEMCKMINRFYD